MTRVVLGIVTDTFRERCHYCGRVVEVVEVSGPRGAKWLQYPPCPHASTVRGRGRTAISDLVDAEVFGDGGVA